MACQHSDSQEVSWNVCYSNSFKASSVEQISKQTAQTPEKMMVGRLKRLPKLDLGNFSAANCLRLGVKQLICRAQNIFSRSCRISTSSTRSFKRNQFHLSSGTDVHAAPSKPNTNRLASMLVHLSIGVNVIETNFMPV